MTESDLMLLTKGFALRVVRLVNALPKNTAGDCIGRQLIRSGTSVAANYRAACRGRSKSEFVAKLGIVEEEADECVFWLEMIIETDLLKKVLVESLHREATELTKIFAASKITARGSNRAKSQIANRNSQIEYGNS